MITYHFEPWEDFLADGEKLFPFHWEELALDKDVIKQDMDHERYLALDRNGALHTTTARFHGELVGYAVNFLMPHMHYKSSGLMALCDMYFVLPMFRKGGTGIKLFQKMEAGLKRKGVVRAHISCKVHQSHKQIFEHMGWKHSDETFTKVLI